jgi:UDP-glucuronate decarboxylase
MKEAHQSATLQDLVDGLIALMNTEDGEDSNPTMRVTSPVNLGNDVEFTIRELVNVIGTVLEEIGQEKGIAFEKLSIEYASLPVDDPRQRKPDITRANELLGWSPTWKLKDGIKEMALSYLQAIGNGQL